MERKVEFKSDKNTLRGTLFIPSGKGPFPSIIFYHGSGARGQKFIDAGKILSKKGFLCLAFNFTGCGESEGKYLDQTHLDSFEDAKAAYYFLRKQKEVDVDRLGIVGSSFGGFVASVILPEIYLNSLVLLSPSAHDDPFNTKIEMGSLESEVEYFKNDYNWINSISYKNVEKFKGSVLAIRAEKDENIPSAVVDKYFEVAKKANKKEMRIIKNGDHRLSTEKMRKEFFDIMFEWFRETL